MVNYALGKIYEITSRHTNKRYIGSSCKKYLSGRLSQHVSNYKMYLNGKYDYVTAFDIIGLGDFIINLIESFPCTSKDELLARERHYIETTENCVNKNIPGRSMSEYLKVYTAANKETIAANKKAYYEENKDANRAKVSEQHKAYYIENKDAINATKQLYRINNAEKIKASKAVTIRCETCDCDINKSHKARHDRTIKHVTGLQNEQMFEN